MLQTAKDCLDSHLDQILDRAGRVGKQPGQLPGLRGEPVRVQIGNQVGGITGARCCTPSRDQAGWVKVIRPDLVSYKSRYGISLILVSIENIPSFVCNRWLPTGLSDGQDRSSQTAAHFPPFGKR